MPHPVGLHKLLKFTGSKKVGPLSDTMTSGNPCVANVLRNFEIVAAEEVNGTM